MHHSRIDDGYYLRRTYTMTYHSVRVSPPTTTEMTAEGEKNWTNFGVLPVHKSLMETKDNRIQWTILKTNIFLRKGKFAKCGTNV